MLASNVSRDVLEDAAREVGVEAAIQSLNSRGTRHRVKLFPSVPAEAYTRAGRRRRGEAGDAPYQRESVGWGTAGRRVHAVCWHGFRDYFRAVFVRKPEARFRTALSTYNGADDFEAKYRETGFRQVGPPIAPVCAAEACRCPERGWAL